jgi:hypothetical protein
MTLSIRLIRSLQRYQLRLSPVNSGYRQVKMACPVNAAGKGKASGCILLAPALKFSQPSPCTTGPDCITRQFRASAASDSTQACPEEDG